MGDHESLNARGHFKLGHRETDIRFYWRAMKTKHFTIINAGMPKTASKSCSAAMEILGYKVADIVETATLLLDVWLAYYDGKATIEDVINEYEKHEFNMNNDL